jgi:hypothetical protein
MDDKTYYYGIIFLLVILFFIFIINCIYYKTLIDDNTETPGAIPGSSGSDSDGPSLKLLYFLNIFMTIATLGFLIWTIVKMMKKPKKDDNKKLNDNPKNENNNTDNHKYENTKPQNNSYSSMASSAASSMFNLCYQNPSTCTKIAEMLAGQNTSLNNK